MAAARPLRKVGVLLAPGASADRTQPALVAMDEALSAQGATVSRMDFPYTLAGKRAPDREPVLVAAVRAEAEALAAASGLAPDRLVLGGRSMGGRICSIAAARTVPAAGGAPSGAARGAPRPAPDAVGALALLLISYPLHPPGRPDRLRTAHFPGLVMPCLFVSGTRDAFGTPAELEAATRLIPGPVTHVWLEGKDHGLRGCEARVSDEVVAWLTEVVRS